MKILSVSFGYPDNDDRVKRIFTHEQSKAIQAQGAEITVLDLNSEYFSDFENFESIMVFRSKMFTYVRNIRHGQFHSIIDVIKEYLNIKNSLANDYDLVILSFLDAMYLPLYWLLFSKTRKMAMTVHGFDAMGRRGWKAKILSKCKMWLLKKVDYIFPVSDYTDTLLRCNYNGNDVYHKKIIINYNGINTEKFNVVSSLSKSDCRSDLKLCLDKTIILTICDLYKRKGVDDIIKALAILVKKNRNIFLIIIGRGDEKDNLKYLADELGVKEYIAFIDYVDDDDDIAKYYKASDIYSMMSKTYYDPPATEGFGISYIEASYLGIPVIGGSNGGSTTAVKHNFTGYLVDPHAGNTVELIADYIKLLSTNSVEYSRISDNGKKMVIDEFTWDRHASKLIDILRQ